MKLEIVYDHKTIGKNILLADTFWLRLSGLIPRKNLQADEGLLLLPCHQVHTWFMSFCLDLVFLNKDAVIVYLISEMKPGKLSPFIKESSTVLELAAGTISAHELKLGEKLNINPL